MRELSRYHDAGLDDKQARTALLLANPSAESFLPPEPEQATLPGTDGTEPEPAGADQTDAQRERAENPDA